MANMNYCRFQNTLTDLMDCQKALQEDDDVDHLSQEETIAKQRLIRLCAQIAEEND